VKGAPFEILLVEDNPDHVELIRRSFAENRVANRLRTVADGQAALDYMFQRGIYSDSENYPRPDVILLDLRLPKVDGLEVLRQIKADEGLQGIPVVILTTSAADQDIIQAYNHSANSYLVKPVSFERFTQLMEDLGYYWLGWNRYPWA
jgi:CheY-like chemotaxis protein